MRKIVVLIGVAFLTACSGSGDGGIGPPPPTGSCSVTEQKQFVLDAMRFWYLWNDLLPADVDINAYATPTDVLDALTAVQPVDQFSSIDTLEADTQFFGEGKYEGYGFSSRFVAADDLRFTRVFVDSPANTAGLARGQRILELNGRTIAEIEAAEGVNAVFDTAPVDFTIREIGGAEFTVNVDVGIVTIDPVPQYRIIPVAGTPGVGYFELAQFISTAEPDFETVFSELSTAGVTDLIIDMRFNGGGLVSTTEILSDYLGGLVAQNLVFSKTSFNDDRASNNDQYAFGLRANSIGLSRLIVIASQGTASASEMIANGMEPHVEVAIVGDRTFGKPVGQVGLNFCDQVLRATAFSLTNADDFGDYFGGLPADCAVTDDLSIAVGADNDPNVEAALTYFATGGCPVISAPGPAKPAFVPSRKFERDTAPHRQLADAY